MLGVLFARPLDSQEQASPKGKYLPNRSIAYRQFSFTQTSNYRRLKP